MREADRLTTDEIGLPGVVLMENAGAAVSRAILERYGEARRIVVLCGKGNNGGDGFVVARHLRAHGALALLLGRREDLQGDARTHMLACERSGGRVKAVPDAEAWAGVRDEVAAADLLVDALLGTGLQSAPRGLLRQGVEALVERAAAGVPVVAVDIPSGVPSDGRDTGGPAVRAALTVTFAAPKWGHVLPPFSEHVGELLTGDIGISSRTLDSVGSSLWLLEEADAAAAFPRRREASHKGGFGHVLVVAGSVGKTGAAILAAGGALRSGAGLVTVASPSSCLAQVAAGFAEAMTEPLPETPTGGVSVEGLDRVATLAGMRDAVVLGPGLGQDPSTQELVLELTRRCPVPLVVDADGLNALAALSDEERNEALKGRPAATVLTPHPGEMGRLVGRSVPEVQAARVQTARMLAEETGAVVILKGYRTVVADPDGRAAVNPTGNAGMATGGTGDVLSGVIGALVARREAWQAATAGVFVHGKAGDLAAEAIGQEGLVAGDLIGALPEAIEMIRAREGESSSR
jgi:NAD(P)H-hydrate epimerase